MDHPAAPDPRPDLATIYRRHADAVATWARRMGGPELDVEDLVHEVFLVVQRRLPEWRGEAKITTWLYEITLRVVQDRRRRRHFWRWLGGGNTARAGRFGDDELDRLAADQPGPVDTLERREASAALYRILDGVAEKYRTVIDHVSDVIYAYFEEYKLQGIADGADVYFVHSYEFKTRDLSDVIATADYGGSLTAAIAKDNVAGVQFHPEKSQAAGLQLLRNFLMWAP